MPGLLDPPPASAADSSRRPPIARVVDDWYVVCGSDALGHRPLPVELYETPLVVFRREDGRPAALLDRCPHRNAPLSLGRVRGDTLECGYHGWRFDGEGSCRAIPGLLKPATHDARAVPAFPTREQDGFVWVYATPDVVPARAPFRFPYLDDPRYVTVRQTLDLEGTLHAAAENALDVPHTAFLHRGLFRGTGATHEIRVEVRRWHDRAEAEYLGEPRPEGILGKVLAPGGGTVTHIDRFLLPCVAQVEYALGHATHIVATTALTPITDRRTRLFGVVSVRLPAPGVGLFAKVLTPLGLRVLKQDAAMLAAQARTIARFGGERYVSTEIDVLGPHILRLLRDAAQGERTPTTEPVRKTVVMRT